MSYTKDILSAKMYMVNLGRKTVENYGHLVDNSDLCSRYHKLSGKKSFSQDRVEARKLIERSVEKLETIKRMYPQLRILVTKVSNYLSKLHEACK